jgi:ribosomal-protein-alanine N-acetyltransferase
MTITTQRLVLRALEPRDATRISLLAGDFEVASMTGTIPHPYTEAMAAEWIEHVHQGEEGVVFAIERETALIGCVGYREDEKGGAELGYWIGKPHWGMGYATEAAAAMVEYAFTEGGLIYLISGHFADNPASARIIAKLGFTAQGERIRDCVARDDKARCLTYRLERGAVVRGSISA